MGRYANQVSDSFPKDKGVKVPAIEFSSNPANDRIKTFPCGMFGSPHFKQLRAFLAPPFAGLLFRAKNNSAAVCGLYLPAFGKCTRNSSNPVLVWEKHDMRLWYSAGVLPRL